MRRQPELEPMPRLSVKTLHQVFVARAQEGLEYPLFEAQALTELVRHVYFPWFTQPEGNAEHTLRWQCGSERWNLSSENEGPHRRTNGS